MSRWITTCRLRRFQRHAFFLVTVALVASCSLAPSRPDLQRLYETARSDVTQPPVVLIPGLMGTRLVSESEGEIWVGSVLDAMLSRYEHAALRINPETLDPDPGDVRPGAITGKFAGRDFYSSIIDTLETAGGFEPAVPGQPVEPGGRYYYVFTYDWRLDNVHTVGRLDDLIEQIRADHGDRDLKVDIVAHSMGGMIARYFLRYGTVDVTNDNNFPVNYHGENTVRRIVLLGTPNLGSVESVKAFIVGRRIGLRRIPPEVLITFPSFYQLFTHPINDWLLDIDGKPIDADPFDLSTWKRFQWSIYDPQVRKRIMKRFDDPEQGRERLALMEKYFHKHIERGRRFIWSLTVNLERSPWQLVVFGGDCDLTPARMVVEEHDERYELHLDPNDIRSPRPGVDYDRLILEPGDGVVTKASLLARESLDPFVPRHPWSFFPMKYPLFLCESHSQLTTNLFFQDNLLHFLLSQDT